MCKYCGINEEKCTAVNDHGEKFQMLTRGIPEDFQDNIVDMHNDYRRKVAKGEETSVSLIRIFSFFLKK